MANEGSKKPKRRVRPAPTVRERAEKTSQQSDKPRRARKAASGASKPFRVVGRFIGKMLRPFRFLLWPFKTKPMRFIGRVLSAIFLLKFFRSAWQELKGVTWPDRKQTTQLTIAVFVFALVFGLIVTIADLGLDKLFKKVLLK
jgi:preprotein translocase SecE subunit